MSTSTFTRTPTTLLCLWVCALETWRQCDRTGPNFTQIT
jgi:hypothetical protein